MQADFRDGVVDFAGEQPNAGPHIDEYEQTIPDRQKPVKFEFKQIETMGKKFESTRQPSIGVRAHRPGFEASDRSDVLVNADNVGFQKN